MANIIKDCFFYVFLRVFGSLWLVSASYKGLDGLDCFDQGSSGCGRS